MQDKGQKEENRMSKSSEVGSRISDFVLDKFIFSNVFEKDIKRIYIYKKSERLAKAIQLIAPAFVAAPSLRNRLDSVAVSLIDAAILPPASAREALSRELLALSSILSVARSGGFLSSMNVDLITREAHLLLQETASYEEPRLFMEDAPTLAELVRQTPDTRDIDSGGNANTGQTLSAKDASFKGQDKGQLPNKVRAEVKDIGNSSRQEAILSILRSKGPSYIKDISTMIREVSEKTIQRELQALVTKGVVQREGDRRWTRYSVPA